MNSPFSFVCPNHPDLILGSSDNELSCPECGRVAFDGSIIDYLGQKKEQAQTAEHYTHQWDPNLGLPARLNQAKAQKFTAASTLPWEELFNRIRSEAAEGEVSVYDAACGWGAILNKLLADPAPQGLRYLGADIHDNLPQAPIPVSAKPEQATLVRWDITTPLPVREVFDYVICRSAAMITPQPAETIATLAEKVAKGGSMAISIYTRKAPMREANDDALRSVISPMDNQAAMEVCRQLANLGSDLQQVEAKVQIKQDLPFLGIKAGEYGVQEFIYDHFLKCWYNPEYGLEHSALVNFDWYHPQYTFRYTLDECKQMMQSAGLEVVHTYSSKYQHFLEAKRLG